MGTNSPVPLAERAVNHVLDKVSSGRRLTPRERAFMEIVKSHPHLDMVDHMLVSNTQAARKVTQMLDLGIGVVCNLRDRDGKMGAPVLSAEVDGEHARIAIEGHLILDLKPSMLYDLTFSTSDFRYSLESDHEYYELAPLRK